MKIIEKYIAKIDDFGMPMVDNPEWKVISTHVVKQRFELLGAEIKSALTYKINTLHKETIFFSDHEDALADITDDEQTPHLLPKSKLLVSLSDVIKIIESL